MVISVPLLLSAVRRPSWPLATAVAAAAVATSSFPLRAIHATHTAVLMTALIAGAALIYLALGATRWADRKES